MSRAARGPRVRLVVQMRLRVNALDKRHRKRGAVGVRQRIQAIELVARRHVCKWSKGLAATALSPGAPPGVQLGAQVAPLGEQPVFLATAGTQRKIDKRRSRLGPDAALAALLEPGRHARRTHGLAAQPVSARAARRRDRPPRGVKLGIAHRACSLVTRSARRKIRQRQLAPLIGRASDGAQDERMHAVHSNAAELPMHATHAVPMRSSSRAGKARLTNVVAVVVVVGRRCAGLERRLRYQAGSANKTRAQNRPNERAKTVRATKVAAVLGKAAWRHNMHEQRKGEGGRSKKKGRGRGVGGAWRTYTGASSAPPKHFATSCSD